MNVFWKAAAGVLTAVILWININKSNKDISLLMTLCVSAMAIIAATGLLQPVVSFIKKLQRTSGLDVDLVSVVLKVVGVGVITDISAMVCKDAGNESLGRTLQFVSTATVLMVSVPVFERLLTLLDKILGTV